MKRNIFNGFALLLCEEILVTGRSHHTAGNYTEVKMLYEKKGPLEGSSVPQHFITASTWAPEYHQDNSYGLSIAFRDIEAWPHGFSALYKGEKETGLPV